MRSTTSRLQTSTLVRFDRSFDINVKGPYFLIRALLPVFASPASVVLNTSINAHVGAARSSVYAATKAALLNLSKTLSGELLVRGIRVNAISPGPVDTPLYDKLGIPDAYRKQVNQKSSRPSRSAASARRKKSPRPCCTRNFLDSKD